MTDIQSFAKATKTSCIKKLIWRKLSGRLEKALSQSWLALLLKILSGGMYTVFESWAEYVREPAEARDFLSQSLWNNIFIEIENKSLFYRSWCIKWYLRYVNDLVDESGSFLSATDLINKHKLECTLLQAFGLTCTVCNSSFTEIWD